MTILLVDDDADLRGALGETLNGAGMEVLLAANGREALDVLEVPTAARPEVVLTDLSMPVMCGEDLADAMAHDGRFAHIPVLRMTATPERRTSLSAPCLTKPFTRGELLQAIERAVPGSTAAEA